MPVNFVYWNSGAGISHDVALMEDIFLSAGISVRHVVTRDRGCRTERVLKALRQMRTALWPRHVQFHFEQIHREQLRHGRYNFILPNPEFTDPDVFRKLSWPPVILCKTRHAKQLFTSLQGSALYIGFTSRDRMMAPVKKDYREFLHVAGLSDFKGTRRLAALWARQPSWPMLTIVRSPKDRNGRRRAPLPGASNIRLIEEWISDETLRLLQNQCGVHLCPSEAEGFGHYIMEGLSCGSVVITTDAAPMNELVSHRNGFLVRAERGPPSFMSMTWHFDDEDMIRTIEDLTCLPQDQLIQMGQAGRRRWLRLDADFRGRIKILLHQYCRGSGRTGERPWSRVFTRFQTSGYQSGAGRI
jgi:glycosyltransferase involved in cell wall biosynthesis